MNLIIVLLELHGTLTKVISVTFSYRVVLQTLNMVDVIEIRKAIEKLTKQFQVLPKTRVYQKKIKVAEYGVGSSSRQPKWRGPFRVVQVLGRIFRDGCSRFYYKSMMGSKNMRS